MRQLLTAAVATGCVLAACAASAQDQPLERDIVRLSAKAEPAEARRGETVVVTITATIKENWHIYALAWTKQPGGPLATTIEFTESGGLKPQGPLQQSTPKTKYDEGFEMEVKYFEGKAEFTQRFLVPDNAPLGRAQIVAKVRYQACDPNRCINPPPAKLSADITIVEGAPREEFVRSSPSTQPPQRSVTATGTNPDGSAGGLWAFLTVAFVAGLLTLLTPCVFPMIPITVSFFTKQTENQHVRAVNLALAYCLGIIVMFTGFGLLITLILGPSGPNAVAANPIVNMLVAAIFVVFALSLFGMFEIQAPSFITNFLNRKSSATSGYVGAILMGFTFTLAAFTCTVPFVGAILAGAATSGKWLYPLLGMLSYSTAFAAPFFFLALFPKWLASLPKSGGWMNVVKVTMAFVELAAALKFLRNVDVIWNWGIFTYNFVLAGWAAIATVTGLYLLGLFFLTHDTKTEKIGTTRVLLSLCFIALGIYLASGLFGQRIHPLIDSFLLRQDTDYTTSAKGDKRLTWGDNLELAKTQARKEDRLIFVDFTGHT